MANRILREPGNFARPLIVLNLCVELGSCSAACTKIATTNLAGQCCSCNGLESYKRSTWNTATYLCQ